MWSGRTEGVEVTGPSTWETLLSPTNLPSFTSLLCFLCLRAVLFVNWKITVAFMVKNGPLDSQCTLMKQPSRLCLLISVLQSISWCFVGEERTGYLVADLSFRETVTESKACLLLLSISWAGIAKSCSISCQSHWANRRKKNSSDSDERAGTLRCEFLFLSVKQTPVPQSPNKIWVSIICCC